MIFQIKAPEQANVKDLVLSLNRNNKLGSMATEYIGYGESIIKFSVFNKDSIIIFS
jgi:hypothetical protein